jgi:D-alanyl-lipoteichoic acid acyltransferase DltB (MBOAT superfamily)
MKRFIYGLGKKVILANTMGEISDIVFDGLNITNNSMAIWTAWIGAIAFSLQIYFDFSGYSDMAIGIGKMFGFSFPENFNYPYMADSITDFWRRWHISLSSWFRDYIYIPCGGNRKGTVRTIINILIVWSLTGLWHGANMTFVIWGFLYGVLLIFEKNFLKKINPIISRLYTLVFVIIGWVIFNSSSLESAIVFVKTMFGMGSNGIWNLLPAKALLAEFKWYFVLAIAGCFPFYKRIQNSKLYCKTIVICIEDIYLLVLLGLSVCAIVNGAYNPFIYFNF